MQNIELNEARARGRAAYFAGVPANGWPPLSPDCVRAWRSGWQDGQDAAALAKLQNVQVALARPRGGYYRGH